MLSAAFLAFCLGIASTITFQELLRANLNYKARKQAQFEEAVQRVALQRERNARHLEEVADMGWSHVEPTDNPRHPSNVRRLTGTDSSPYKFDDPYADI